MERARARLCARFLSGKNYPLFLRQILHEIFMVRVDSIDFGQLGRFRPSVCVPAVPRPRATLPSAGLIHVPVQEGVLALSKSIRFLGSRVAAKSV